MWTSHWKLSRDPFLGGEPPYVPVPAHAEAVARLVHTIETFQRQAVVRAAAGLGKSVVLARALAESRHPLRRVARAVSPADGTRADRHAGRSGSARASRPAPGARAAWKALGDAVRLCRWQRLHVVLAVDDAQDLTDTGDRLDLERLAHLDPHPEARLTVLQSLRTTGDGPAPPPWELAIRLPALTRGEAEQYLTAKLAAAGRDDPTFTPRALNLLHARSGGVPRGLDRLASLALMAGALRGLEIITPDVVEGVALECTPQPAAFP